MFPCQIRVESNGSPHGTATFCKHLFQVLCAYEPCTVCTPFILNTGKVPTSPSGHSVWAYIWIDCTCHLQHSHEEVNRPNKLPVSLQVPNFVPFVFPITIAQHHQQTIDNLIDHDTYYFQIMVSNNSWFLENFIQWFLVFNEFQEYWCLRKAHSKSIYSKIFREPSPRITMTSDCMLCKW